MSRYDRWPWPRQYLDAEFCCTAGKKLFISGFVALIWVSDMPAGNVIDQSDPKAMTPPEGLLGNPFAVLGISVHASDKAIEEAFFTAKLQRRWPEQVLLKARRLLLEPRTRLLADLMFLHGVPNRHKNILKLLQSASPFKLKQAALLLPPLAKASLMAHIGLRRPSPKLLDDYVAASASIDPVRIHAESARLRINLDLPVPDFETVSEALDLVDKTHAAQIFKGYDDPTSAASDLLVCIDNALTATKPAQIDACAKLVGNFSEIIAVALQSYRRQLDVIASTLLTDHPDPMAMSHFEEALRGWARLAAPQQRLDVARNMGAGLSSDICRFLRDLAREVESRHAEPIIALRIYNLALALFGDLPGITGEIEGDIALIRAGTGNSPGQAEAQEFEYFIALQRDHLATLAQELVRKTFATDPICRTSLLFTAFDHCLDNTVDTMSDDAAWQSIMVLNAELAANADWAPASAVLQTWLKKHRDFGRAPADIRASINEDLNPRRKSTPRRVNTLRVAPRLIETYPGTAKLAALLPTLDYMLLAKDIDLRGFNPTSIGTAKALYEAFDEAAKAVGATDDDILWKTMAPVQDELAAVGFPDLAPIYVAGLASHKTYRRSPFVERLKAEAIQRWSQTYSPERRMAKLLGSNEPLAADAELENLIKAAEGKTLEDYRTFQAAFRLRYGRTIAIQKALTEYGYLVFIAVMVLYICILAAFRPPSTRMGLQPASRPVLQSPKPVPKPMRPEQSQASRILRDLLEN